MKKFNKGRIIGNPIGSQHHADSDFWVEQASRNPVWQRAMNGGRQVTYKGSMGWYETPWQPGDGNAVTSRDPGAGCCVNGCGCGCICARNCHTCMCSDARNFKRPQPGDCGENFTY